MNFKKSISFVLTMCMVFSLFATFVIPAAAEGPTYTLIDTVEDLKAGTYYMSGWAKDAYQVFTGSAGSKGDLYTATYSYTDGVLETTDSYKAVAVKLEAVEGKENTYTIYVEGKGYLYAKSATSNRQLALGTTVGEWVVSNNSKGGITFATTVGGATTYMGTNNTASSMYIRNYTSESTLTYGLVFFAEDVEEEVVPPVVAENVALGKNYAANGILYTDHKQNWPDDGGVTLTDGVYAPDAGYSNAEWVGFNSGTPYYKENGYASIIVNLEAVYSLNKVVTTVSNVDDSGIIAPSAIKVAFSIDGTTWTDAVDVAYESELASGTIAKAVATVEAEAQFVKFMYIKGSNWMFIDEVEAYGEVVEDAEEIERNVAFLTDYAISGCKTPYAQYTASLTDSNAQAKLSYDYNWFTFYCNGNDTSVINAPDHVGYVVIDLGKVYDLSSVKAHCYDAKGSSGINGPAALNIYLSEDNETWSDAIAVEIPALEAASDYWTETAVSGKAQYVKFEAKLNGTFAFVNEIEVYNAVEEEPEEPVAGTELPENLSQCGAPYGDLSVLLDGYTGVGVVNTYDGFQDKLFGIANANLNETAYSFTVVFDEAKTFNTVSIYALDFYNGCVHNPADLAVVINGVEYDVVVGTNPSGISESVATLGEEVTAKAITVKVVMGASDQAYAPFNMFTEVAVSTETVEEDDDSFKDTFTYVDGVNNGTAQSRADGWESIPVVDFWYLVEDGVDTITIKYAVDNKKVSVEDTKLRIWLDTDVTDAYTNKFTTLYDFFVNESGEVYNKPHTSHVEGSIVSYEYKVVGNDYFFTLVLDKAALGIEGQYGLDLQIEQKGYNTLHSIEWDAFDNALTPWTTTEFYEVFGDADTFKNDYTYVDGEIVGTTQSREDGWESIPGADFWYKVTDTEEMVFVYVMVDNRNVLPGVLNADKPTQLDSGTSLRLWIDADLSDTGRTTLVDVAYIDGAAKAYRVDNNFAAAVSTDFAIDGNDYGFCVVLDKAALGIDGQYGMIVTLSETGYNTMHNVAWDVYDVANCAPWNTTKDYIVYGTSEEPKPEEPTYGEGWTAEFDADEVEIFKGDIPMLGDGKWGEDAVAYGNEAVILIRNLVCKNPELYPTFSLVYNAGKETALNNIKVGIYAETNSMIGYPSKDAKVYVSNDGIEWTLVESTNNIPESVFGVFHDPSNSLGTSLVDIVLAETVSAQYVKVEFTYTDSPFTDPSDYKPVYEFIAFTEAEVSLVEEETEELPEEAIGLDIYGYTHTHLNYVMYVDADMTLGELVTKYFGQSKDLNYFKVIVVNEDGTVAATYLTLGRPDGVKTDFTVTAGQYVLALSADGSNAGRFEIADTVKVGDIVTLYNVDFTAESGELKNAGFTVESVEEDNDNVVVPDGYGSADVLVDGYTGAGEIFGYEGNKAKLFAFNYLVANAEYSFTVSFETNVKFDSITLFGLDYANGCVVIPEKVAFVVNGNSYEATIIANPNGIARMFVAFEEAVTADEITVVITTDGNANFFNMFTEIKVSEVTDEEVITSDVVTDFNLGDWTDGKFGADAAVIFTDADIYAAANQIWWFHAAFAPTSVEGVYELVATRGASQDAFLTIPEGGFVWVAHDTAAEGTAGAFAFGMISTLKVGDRVVFNGVDFENATTKEDATAEKVVAPESVDIKVSHNNLYNWGTFESMLISEPGKTVTEVIGQTPYWWIMYVVEEVDGVYVATEFYKNCDEINTTVCPENGFLFYVYSSNSNWADADYGKLLGCYFILGDIDLSAKFAIDTQKGEEPYIMQVVSGFKTGDANMNGKIDANDYAMARKAAIGKLELTEAQIKLLDVNGNGKVDANDYMLIKRHVLGTYTIPAWADVE